MKLRVLTWVVIAIGLFWIGLKVTESFRGLGNPEIVFQEVSEGKLSFFPRVEPIRIEYETLNRQLGVSRRYQTNLLFGKIDRFVQPDHDWYFETSRKQLGTTEGKHEGNLDMPLVSLFRPIVLWMVSALRLVFRVGHFNPYFYDHLYVFGGNFTDILDMQENSLSRTFKTDAVNSQIRSSTQDQRALHSVSLFPHYFGLIFNGPQLPLHGGKLPLGCRDLIVHRVSLPFDFPESASHYPQLPAIYSGLHKYRDKKKKLKDNKWIRPFTGVALVLLSVIPGLPGVQLWYRASFALSGLLLCVCGALAFGGTVLALSEPKAQN